MIRPPLVPTFGLSLGSLILLQAGLTAAPQQPPAHPAANLAFTTLDVPFGQPGVDLDMQIVWINDAGVITVQYQSPRSPNFLENMHTAVLDHGAWTVIDAPGAVSTGGTNANNRGQVVLTVDFGNGIWRAGYHDRTGLSLMPLLPGYPGGTLVQGVNDHGAIAAVVVDAGGGFHAMVGKGANLTVFDFPGPTTVATQANMINNHGFAVGTYFLGDGSNHAFLHHGNQTINIDPPIGHNASATSITDSGIVLGLYTNPANMLTGYVQSGPQLQHFHEVHVPGAVYTVPYSINDRGEITGVYGDAAGVAHGFVARPTH